VGERESLIADGFDLSAVILCVRSCVGWQSREEGVAVTEHDLAEQNKAVDREGGKVFLGGFLNAFPDATFTIDDMIAEGDQVVTKKTFTGTQQGDFFGVPASGNKVTVQFVDIMRVREGWITEHWLCMDQLTLMQQLGAIPSFS
jgi:predicted ester cyclase